MNHKHSHDMGKHMLLMVVCCLVPLVLVGAVGTFGLSLGPLQGLVPYVAALMCPLMMVGMMWMMMKNQGDDESHHTEHRHVTQLPATHQEQTGLTATPAVEGNQLSGSGSCH